MHLLYSETAVCARARLSWRGTRVLNETKRDREVDKEYEEREDSQPIIHPALVEIKLN